MTNLSSVGWKSAVLLTAAHAVAAGPAYATTVDYIDLTAGFGYSSNPGLSLDSKSSVFGRVSAFGSHSWRTERNTTTLTAYLENSTYFKRYGSKPIFDLEAHTSQIFSPNVTVFGDLGLQGDFAGQLSNRLLTVPTEPVIVEPGNPLPPTTANPDVFGLSGRQYRLFGQAGASIRTSKRSSILLSAGAQRQVFTGNSDADYNTYFASAGYSHQISERTSAGASVFFQRQDFQHGDYANVVNPVVTIQTSLRENLVADAAIGVMSLDQRIDGHHDHSISPSFSGGLCSTSSSSGLCVRIARDARSSLGSRITNVGGGAAISTSLGVSYFKRLSERDTWQASLSAVRYTTPDAINNLRIRSTYLTAVTGYDRKIGNRLAAGVQGGLRRLFQVGPDPDLDFNANAYLRYRIGDLK